MDNSRKIQNVSRFMSIACVLALVVMPLLNLWIWLSIERLDGVSQGIPILPEFIGTSNKIFGFLASMIPTGFLMWGVWRLRALFNLFSKSVFFTEANVQLLHSFAAMLLYSLLASPVADVLTSLAITIGYPEGQRTISLNLGSGDIDRLFIAIVFLAIAWVFKEGHKLATENAEFV